MGRALGEGRSRRTRKVLESVHPPMLDLGSVVIAPAIVGPPHSSG